MGLCLEGTPSFLRDVHLFIPEFVSISETLNQEIHRTPDDSFSSDSFFYNFSALNQKPCDPMAERPGYQRKASTNLTNVGKGSAYRPHEGKLAIITGGSRSTLQRFATEVHMLTRAGIGAAVAENLASKGCSLLLNYTSNSSTELTNALCTKLSKTHSVKCVPVQADLSIPTRAVAHILSTARNNFSHPKTSKFQIDILINNAGVAGDKLLNDAEQGPIDELQFHKMYDINVLAPLLLAQACAPYLPTDRSGRIVNVSSVSSKIGYMGQSVYAGTKGALEAMTRTWARELADKATVNAINPGPVWGDMYAGAGSTFWKQNQPFVDAAPLMQYGGEEHIKAMAGDEKQQEEFDRIVREGMGGRRPAFTSEIAGVVGMLCSEESGWTTGSVICANGGAVMSIG